MPSPTERAAIVAAWRAAGGRSYRRLAEALGGVNRGTAWREANRGRTLKAIEVEFS